MQDKDNNKKPKAGISALDNQNKKDENSNPSDLNPSFNLTNFTATEFQSEANKMIAQFPVDDSVQSNPFPLEIFPTVIQDIIKATNSSLNYPIDFIGSSVLFAASLAVGITHKIEVRKGWIESGVLYIAMVGRAGTNKSHPLSFALQPFFDLDSKTFKDYERQKNEFELAANLSKKDRKEQGSDNLVKPFWNKFIVTDFTPEALATVHKYNTRGIGVYVDELAGWFKNFNRYNKGSEMEFWLSAWSGKPINVDRKTSDPIYIPHPFIGVAGTIQNAVINELAKDSRSHNGFIDRILFAVPDNLQKESWSESEIDPIIITNWVQIISNIIDLNLKNDSELNPTSTILRFNHHAWDVIKEWQIKNTAMCNDAETESIASIYSKLEVYVLRLALIIEILYYGCNESDKKDVSLNSVNGAIKLIEYFRKTALQVNAIINNYDPLDRLPADKRELYKLLPQVFTTDDGVNIAAHTSNKISERNFKRFLKDKEYFKCIKRGFYEKCI